jgi:hypothetical protein
VTTYDKFYDDYERGTWFISPLDADNFVSDIIVVDGLTGPQADAIPLALNTVEDRVNRLAKMLDETQATLAEARTALIREGMQRDECVQGLRRLVGFIAAEDQSLLDAFAFTEASRKGI